jgi:methionyl-tRNA formyltransferase
MNVIFMGTPDYARHILDTLIMTGDINVVAVYTQPDKPVGRKKLLTPSAVKVLALENGIPVYQPARLRDETVVKELTEIACDFIVVAAYGQILSQEILDHAPCINLHASILPRYRGASPIQQTLLNGDSETGVTAMLMNAGLDTGDILKIARISVKNDEMAETLFERLTALACEVIIDVLHKFTSLHPVPQDDSLATYCTKITRADGKIAFDDALSDYNKYRAFVPWPGIFLESGLKIKQMKLESYCEAFKPGEILAIDDKSAVVGCRLGKVRIFRVQPPSKKEMSIIDYLNGRRLTLADILA